jgi:hypothetical protein
MPKSSDTRPVSDTVFRQVYDSPASLPGRHTWLTSTDDVRRVEEILGMPRGTIGAALWVSGDRQQCASCNREINWLDIVSSALSDTHSREMIARVILCNQKFVNVEAPRAIAGVRCADCDVPFNGLRSFKCHNWAYAKPALLEILERMEAAASST